MTRNEIPTAMNKRDDFVLALVEVDGIAHQPVYLRKPPFRDPGCSEVSVTFDLKGLPTLAERRS